MINTPLFHPELLRDRVALITGGRSGIGYETARLFLTLGARVMIASRKEEPLRAACDTLSQWGEVKAHPCDIRDPEQIASLAQELQTQFGQLNILINNAGGQFPTTAEHLNPKGWDAVIRNNLNGTFYVTREMANRFFIPQKQGVIVNVTACVARGFPGMIHTGAARAGVENLSKTLAQEWAHHHIRINCVAPGIIASSGLDSYPEQIKTLLDEAAQSIPAKRLGENLEVARAICFLASDLSSYCNGITLPVDGAQHLNYDNLGLVRTIHQLLGGSS